MVLNVILMIYLAHVGLALATSLSAVLNASLLYIGLRSRGVYSPNSGWLLFAGKLILANGLMLMMLLWLTPDVSHWQGWTAWQRFGQLMTLIVGSALAYFVVLSLLGIRIKQFIRPKQS